jgi:hypothetical protein
LPVVLVRIFWCGWTVFAAAEIRPLIDAALLSERAGGFPVSILVDFSRVKIGHKSDQTPKYRLAAFSDFIA